MLPKDPIILLSYVNTQLRDNFDSLDDMCKTFSNGKVTSAILLKQKLTADLSGIDYEYDESTNQFI